MKYSNHIIIIYMTCHVLHKYNDGYQRQLRRLICANEKKNYLAIFSLFLETNICTWLMIGFIFRFVYGLIIGNLPPTARVCIKTRRIKRDLISLRTLPKQAAWKPFPISLKFMLGRWYDLSCTRPRTRTHVRVCTLRNTETHAPYDAFVIRESLRHTVLRLR